MKLRLEADERPMMLEECHLEIIHQEHCKTSFSFLIRFYLFPSPQGSSTTRKRDIQVRSRDNCACGVRNAMVDNMIDKKLVTAT